MTGYKVTYDMKCRDLTYEVGKIYSVDTLKMCSIGFHFCKDMKDVLDYYPHNDTFILLEVETMGKVITEGNKTVTDSLKILRVVPKEEYTFKMPLYEYDEKNNKISETNLNGSKLTYEYDERNNKISETDSDGFKLTYEYDERNNRISKTTLDGSTWTYEYDERNNKISQTSPTGNKWTREYDERNNMISQTTSNGFKLTWEYDEKNNKISQTDSCGYKWRITIS